MRDRRLQEYGGRMVTVDDRPTVELVDPNDNSRRVFQYRRAEPCVVERRVLSHNHQPLLDWKTGLPDSSWEAIPSEDLASMFAARGSYHPILSPLQVTFRDILQALRGEPKGSDVSNDDEEIEP